MVAFKSKLLQYDSVNLSAAILVAAYGDCPWSAWSSSIGIFFADP